MFYNMRHPIRLLILLLGFIIYSTVALGQSDWPMWRCDYNRSGYTPEKLADKLHL